MKFLLIHGNTLEMPKEFGLDKEVLSGILDSYLGKTNSTINMDNDKKKKIVETLSNKIRF
jgi:hypothetical protein